MAGLFDGTYGQPRPQHFSTPQPIAGPGWMNMGPQGGGSTGDPSQAQAGALQQYGPNGLLALQMYQAMMQQGPRGLMDPQNASQWFTPDTIGGLAPRYQDAFAAQNKGGKK